MSSVNTSAISSNTNKEFGKVAVVMGGWAAERSISLKSGHAVLEGLLEQGIDAHKVDADRNVIDVLIKGKFDCVFNILHGRGGEDGEIQGALEISQIPYTGCGVMSSAISMDKLMTKRIWNGANLPTPVFEILTVDSDFAATVEKLGLPLIVKPAQEGSSIGMTKVTKAEQLKAAYEKAAEFDDIVFAEQWVTGKEFTVAILGDVVLPPIQIVANTDFYDFDAKYESNETEYYCPCDLDEKQDMEIKSISKEAFAMLGGNGWGRVDLMQDSHGKFWLIEVNTTPGMTDHSLVPMAAKQHGLSFSELTVEILKTVGLGK